MPFAAGQRLSASLLNNTFPPSSDITQLAAGTTVSTLYVTLLTGGATCGVPFVAPLSGKVLILFYARLRNSAANISLMSFRLGTGSTLDAGTQILAASDNICIQHTGTADEGASAHAELTGLTPLAAYNVVCQHRANGGTATYASRRITAVPVI